MTDCVICCEKLSKSIICNFCEFQSCSTCTRRYLLETDSDPHCMNCKKQWSRDFLDSSFPKVFVNKNLKVHRENNLIDRQKSLLPATQHLVERELHQRKYQNRIKKLYERRRQLHIELTEVNGDIREDYNRLYYGDGKENVKQDKHQFIRKCPSEDCMGYLSSQWKCGICNLWSCPECHEVKGDNKDAEHTCNPDNVETAKLINKETHPCPSCATRIFKIDGCDQMFCTHCQTSFSWKTGQKVISGVIHNPHYYEFMRNQNNGNMPRQAGDVPCGGLPNIYRVSDVITKFKLPPKHFISESLYDIHRAVSHIQYTELTRFDFIEQNNETNSDLRVLYMLKEISEESWKKTLQKREKKNQKNLEVTQILQMFIDTASDIFRTILDNSVLKDVNTNIDTLEALRTYSNSSLDKISSRYSCVVPRIFDDWIVTNIKV